MKYIMKKQRNTCWSNANLFNRKAHILKNENQITAVFSQTKHPLNVNEPGTVANWMAMTSWNLKTERRISPKWPKKNKEI